MTDLTPALASRCGKIIARFGSDRDAEVVAAGRALVRTLTGAGLDLNDLAEHVSTGPRTVVLYRDRPAERPAGPRSYGDWRAAWAGRPGRVERERVLRCRSLGGGHLSPWEEAFLDSLVGRLDRALRLTTRQIAVLVEIEAKVGARL